MVLSWSHELKAAPAPGRMGDSLSGCRERGTTAAHPLHPTHLEVLGYPFGCPGIVLCRCTGSARFLRMWMLIISTMTAKAMDDGSGKKLVITDYYTIKISCQKLLTLVTRENATILNSYTSGPEQGTYRYISKPARICASISGRILGSGGLSSMVRAMARARSRAERLPC